MPRTPADPAERATLHEQFAAAQCLRGQLERVPDQTQIVASEAHRLILRCPFLDINAALFSLVNQAARTAAHD